MTSRQPGPISSTSRRMRPGVASLLVYIAATAVGLALTRSLPAYLHVQNQTVLYDPDDSGGLSYVFVSASGRGLSAGGRRFRERPSYWLAHVPYWSAPCLLTWTAAALIGEIRGSGLRRRRLMQRPGVLANIATLAALFALGLRCFQLLVSHGMSRRSVWDGWQEPWMIFWASFAGLAGYTVAVTWIVFAIRGCWRTRVDARDVPGIVLGWCWIAMALMREIGAWCFAWNW